METQVENGAGLVSMMTKLFDIEDDVLIIFPCGRGRGQNVVDNRRSGVPGDPYLKTQEPNQTIKDGHTAFTKNIQLCLPLHLMSKSEGLKYLMKNPQLVSAVLEIWFDCGSGAGVLRSPEPVRLGRWNTIAVYRHRWDAWLKLNGGKRVRGRSKGLFSRMTFREPVWVGGGGNTTGLLSKLGLAEGLLGCVDSLKINGDSYRLPVDAVAANDVGCVRPLSLFYSDASADGVEDRELVPRSRSHARFRRNATMIHAFLCVDPAFIDL
ncbi:Pikachurin [Eumeta japonica]|uniref:Pikachurin n=1 Tax=Eumeta variegata TaxID=151549 RepID=A0A4C1V2S8_EUMVA|nr:Pikachurin [Eumeta japonica]